MWFLFSFFMFFKINAYAQNSLVFNVTGQPPLNTSKHDGFMDEVTREALRRIGYKLIIKRHPAERGLHSINKGFIDGEMSRVNGIDKTYQNIIKVPEKIMDWGFYVFSNKNIKLKSGWKSLAHKNVSFINGWKIIEKNIPKTANVIKTKNSKQLFNLLKKERTDFVIYERWGGHYMINKNNLKNIVSHSSVLISKEMHIYLHKKHAALIPKLSSALASMKKDGSYQKMVDKHLVSEQGKH